MLARCRSLKSIEIPSNVAIICNGAFAECCSCQSFSIEDKNIRIGVRVFEGCDILLNNDVFVQRMKRHLENTIGEK